MTRSNTWYFGLVLCLLATTALATEHEQLHSILADALKESQEATPILMQMKLLATSTDKSYQSITDIGASIESLHSLLLQAQIDDDNKFAIDSKEIQDKIDAEEVTISGIKKTRQGYRDTLAALKAERQRVEDIYQSDRNAYLNRVAKQEQLKLSLQELIEKSTSGLLQNPAVPQSDPSPDAGFANFAQVLAQVKEIGHERPIEALVELTKIFTKGDAQNLVDRFQALLDAVKQSQDIDQRKEDYNLSLYVILTNNLDNDLIPAAQKSIDDLNAEIKVHRKVQADLRVELQRITDVYNFRKTERANAIAYSEQATQKLNSELANLQQNETLIRAK